MGDVFEVYDPERLSGWGKVWIGAPTMVAGWWVISGSLHISVKRLPTRWSRLWHRALLGWQWFPQSEYEAQIAQNGHASGLAL